jgi:hypothetical protein
LLLGLSFSVSVATRPAASFFESSRAQQGVATTVGKIRVAGVCCTKAGVWTVSSIAHAATAESFCMLSENRVRELRLVGKQGILSTPMLSLVLVFLVCSTPFKTQ